MAPSSQLIRALAAEALAPSALRLLALFASQPLTASAGTRKLVRELPCAPSTAFAALARLRKFGLIENGRAEPVHLTPAGLLVHQAKEVIA